MPKVDKIKQVKEEVEDDLLSRPGVTGVGVGYKYVGGKRTNETAIVVYVNKKKALKDIPEKERIPKKIQGVSTDVIEREFILYQHLVPIENFQLAADTTTYDPLRGGISIGPCRLLNVPTMADANCRGVPAAGNYITVGTLGTFVEDNASGDVMMLSNFHVMAMDNGWNPGDNIVQPGRPDGGVCPTGVVGQLQRAVVGGEVDCAVATLINRSSSCEIVDIGYVTGQVIATLGMAVRKRGRTTGLTYGTIDTINLTVIIDFCDGIGPVTFINQIGIAVDSSQSTQFGISGDSGSVVVDASRRVVGLFFAGNQTGTYGVANPIQSVLDALDVRLCVGLATLQFLDTNPSRDFGTHPWIDRGTIPWLDIRGTDPQLDTHPLLDVTGTDPRLDPYKLPGYDKPPAGDVSRQPPVSLPPLGNATPFIMATPHHATGVTGQSQGQVQALRSRYETELKEREEALTKMNESYESGNMSATEYQQFIALCGEYQTLVAQYQQLASL